MSENQNLSKKFDIFGNLSRELSEKILFLLTPDDVVNVFNCCKKWQKIMDYEFVWKAMFKKTYNDFDKEPTTEIYKNMLQAHSSQWLGRYMYSYALENNFKNSNSRGIFLKLDANAYDLIHFDDRHLILGSWGVGVIIINSSTGLIEKKIPLTYYSNPIKHGDLLISVLHHSELVIWDIKNVNCIEKVPLDSNGIISVKKLQACKHLVTVTTRDSKVFVFNSKTGRFHQLQDSKHIYCAEDAMAIARQNGAIDIVNTNFQHVAPTTSSTMDNILQISMTADFLITAFEQPQVSIYLSVWNITKNEDFKIKLWSLRKSKFHVTPKNLLICSQSLNRFEVWNLCKQSRIFRIDIDLPCPCFSFDDRYLFFPGNNKPLWCIKTENFIPIELYYRNSRFLGSTTSKFVLNYAVKCREYWQILDYEKNM